MFDLSDLFALDTSSLTLWCVLNVLILAGLVFLSGRVQVRQRQFRLYAKAQLRDLKQQRMLAREARRELTVVSPQVRSLVSQFEPLRLKKSILLMVLRAYFPVCRHPAVSALVSAVR